MADPDMPQPPRDVATGHYQIAAKVTRYKGALFRSRLEAKWAAFFDHLGFDWQYEPLDLDGWVPDFSLKTATGPLFVEVKPIFDLQEVPKVRTAPGEHLLVGTAPLRNKHSAFGDSDRCVQIGWFVNGSSGISKYDDDAFLCGIAQADHYRIWGIIGDTHSWADRISGLHDGDHFLRAGVDDPMTLWNMACATVRRVN